MLNLIVAAINGSIVHVLRDNKNFVYWFNFCACALNLACAADTFWMGRFWI